jgi:Rod binding domain-containing protein
MNGLSPAPGLTAADPARAQSDARIRHAAQEFEAVLLESLLQPLEKSFSTLPGKDDLSGADTYHYLGTQALASALAHSGGLGLAAMMVRTMLKPHGLSAKVPGHGAD